MKIALFLIVVLLVETSPAFGEVTRKDLEEVTKTSDERMKAYVDLKFEAFNARQEERDKRAAAEMQGLRGEISSTRVWILAAFGIVAVALGFLYRLFTDVQRSLGQVLERTAIFITEWGNRAEALEKTKKENAALRTEVSRLQDKLERLSSDSEQPKPDDEP